MSNDKNGVYLGDASDTASTSLIDFMLNTTKEWNRDGKNIMDMMPAVLQLQEDKAKAYGRSWCNNGDVELGDFDAFMNLRRKWHRVDNIMREALRHGLPAALFGNDNISGTATESFMDTLIDLGLYAFMWAGFIRDRYPDLWRQFVESNHLDDRSN